MREHTENTEREMRTRGRTEGQNNVKEMRKNRE